MITVDLQDINFSDIDLVGGKAMSLAHLIQELSKRDIKVPQGFVVTTNAYRVFIEHNELDKQINEILKQVSERTNDIHTLKISGIKIRDLIQNAEIPPDLEKEITIKYNKLCEIYNIDNVDVACRSSAIGEDGSTTSFAGQLDTFLNVRGISDIMDSVKRCFASLYTDRVISYRQIIDYKDNVKMAVVIQKMIEPETSGVAFSIDTETGFNKVIIINASWGLGEAIVSGIVNPDEYVIFKDKLKEGYSAIIDKKLGKKQQQIIYSMNKTNKQTKLVDVHPDKQNIFCLNDNNILKLATWVMKIEEYYSSIYNKLTPVDIEWAIDSKTNELYILQTRPETVQSNANKNVVTEYKIIKDKDTSILTKGTAVGDNITVGIIRIINTLTEIDTKEFNNGDILVTGTTNPDWEPIMAKSGGIITNCGGRTSHAAIIMREFGITGVVGTINATEILKDGETVTVSCCEGEVGFVYQGKVNYTETHYNLNELPETKTQIMFNVASPNDVFKYAFYPAKGVGLVREEFIINNYIQVHPMALVNYYKLEDLELVNTINDLIQGYDSPTDYYVNKLAFGLARIAATFNPYDVIVRFSDFKSNEYKNLLGGYLYEPEEENAMIAFRGASRYYSPLFKEAFGLECLAIKKVREIIGLTYVIVMIPFCRTVEECQKVLDTMKEYGLERGVNNLKVYIMCEIPSNVILANEFCKLVDGFSIGSNDLTQLTLGLDRDSELVSHIYDERNPAVKKMISKAIRACHKNKVKIGLCGQAPSDYPEFAQFLVEEGIDSISITPDALLKTLNAISILESKNC